MQPKETHWPVLVIDEANVLMSWTDSHPAELRGLLQFFVTITKQKLCHVVMATAESRYPTWLSNRGCALEAACLPSLPVCLVCLPAGSVGAYRPA